MGTVADLDPRDLAVVIPTRDRLSVLTRTLDALARQTATGFETWEFDGVRWAQRHVGTANNPISVAMTFDWWRGVRA